MAPSRASRGNKREADYSNIGVAGRKTGITLRDTGIRDENGMEPLDGIFSSPEKSSAKKNGIGFHSTITEEEDMDIGHSTIPEPTAVLTASRKQNSKLRLPPPHARSPIKTALGSSPRRSIGPMSSPRRNGESPSRAMSHPLVNRKLNFSAEENRASIERSPMEIQSAVTSVSAVMRNAKVLQSSRIGRKRPFDLSMDDGEDEEYSSAVDDTEPINEASLLDEEPLAPMNIEESFQTNGNSSLESPDLLEQRKARNGPKRRTGRPKKASEEPALPSKALVVDEPPVGHAVTKKRRGRPPKKQIFDIDESGDIPAAEEIVEKQLKKRGRKKADSEVHHEEVHDEPDPPKPAKHSRTAATGGTPTKASRRAAKPPPSERSPNARITAAKGNGKASSAEPMSSTALGKPKSRSLYVLRSETPAEDDGSRLLRSGRTSVKPVAYWRGERIVYGEPSLEGKNLVLPGIKEVVRTEEVVDSRPRKYPRRKGGVPRQRPLEDVEEDDEDQEPWEMAPGTLRAEVLQWDPITERGIEDNIEHVELALAPAALQDLTREVKGAEFTFAKTLTLPFFHTGVVDLPPGGVKRMKNSRRNHMAFWVFYGRVRVNVAGTEFSIGRGGMWQVPRGNFYGIVNDYANPARILFAQGCYMTEAEAVDEANEAEEGVDARPA